jgi:uncharacterized membrane protein YecN with MAPEG domain
MRDDRSSRFRRQQGVIQMQFPSITSGYLAVLALIYAALGLNVAWLRRKNLALFGDDGNLQLRSAIRAHAHFAEYVPITALMVAMLEMAGAASLRIHLLMGMLLVSRLLHPLGMYAKPPAVQFTVGRIGGMTLTIAVMIASASQLLLQIWRAS